MLTLVLLLLVVGLLIFRLPDRFAVTRSAELPAPPAAIFAQINDLQAWQSWSPWARLDPAAVATFDGPQSGVGAVMRWDGNNNVGKGSMTITESIPDALVRFRLDFVKPMQGTSQAEFMLTPLGDRTLVRWTMTGTNNFIGKAMGLVMNCENMVGGQFEQGFANLRAVLTKMSAS